MVAARGGAPSLLASAFASAVERRESNVGLTLAAPVCSDPPGRGVVRMRRRRAGAAAPLAAAAALALPTPLAEG